MDVRGFVGVVGAAALVAPLSGWTPMSVAASGTSRPAPTAVSASACFPSIDNGDPVLRSLDFSPRDVDARQRAQTVTFTAVAEDTGGPGAPSGVTEGTVFLSVDGSANCGISTPLKPDGAGALIGTLTIPTYFRTATRYVALSVSDAAGNSTMYSTDELHRMGLPATFTTTTSDPDVAKPQLQSVRLSEQTLDTRRHRRTLTVRVRATDDTGLAGIRVWLWGSPVRHTGLRMRLVSGTPAYGKWRARLGVPRWQGNSTAKLAIELTDVVQRSRFYGPKKLAAIGQPGTVRVVSDSDPTPPTVRLRTVTPNSVDLRTGQVSVTVVARVTARGAATRAVAVNLDGPESGSGGEVISGRLVRISGTTRDGLWQGTLRLRACRDVAGKWDVTVFAWDAAQGDFVTSRASLVVANDDTRRPVSAVVGDSSAVRRGGPLTVAFNEDVVGLNATNTLVHVGYSQRGQGGDDPTPISGTWACQDVTRAVVDCTSGPVRTAAFTPASPLISRTNHTLVLNPEHQLGLTDLAGNPADPLGGGVSFQTD